MPDRLPLRQEQVLLLLMEGKEYKEISDVLRIAPGTIKGVVSMLLNRLRARNTRHAIFIALKEGYITLDTRLNLDDPTRVYKIRRKEKVRQAEKTAKRQVK